MSVHVVVMTMSLWPAGRLPLAVPRFPDFSSLYASLRPGPQSVIRGNYINHCWLQYLIPLERVTAEDFCIFFQSFKEESIC